MGVLSQCDLVVKGTRTEEARIKISVVKLTVMTSSGSASPFLLSSLSGSRDGMGVLWWGFVEKWANGTTACCLGSWLFVLLRGRAG